MTLRALSLLSVALMAASWVLLMVAALVDLLLSIPWQAAQAIGLTGLAVFGLAYFLVRAYDRSPE